MIFRKKKSVGRKNYKDKLLSKDTSFAVAEAYRSLRANLMYTGSDVKCPVYGITSAAPNEGKSLNCCNLAVSFAQLGKKVLLIDGDMRNPSVDRVIDLPGQNGTSEYLAGIDTAPNFQKSEIDNLWVMVAGKIPPDPTSLLASIHLDMLFERAREEFDYVFVDLPPVSLVSDAVMLASKLNGYLFVVESGVSDARLVQSAVRSLEMVDAKIAGFVLNSVSYKNDKYYARRKYGKRYGKYGYSKYGYAKYGYGKATSEEQANNASR